MWLQDSLLVKQAKVQPEYKTSVPEGQQASFNSEDLMSVPDTENSMRSVEPPEAPANFSSLDNPPPQAQGPDFQSIPNAPMSTEQYQSRSYPDMDLEHDPNKYEWQQDEKFSKVFRETLLPFEGGPIENMGNEGYGWVPNDGGSPSNVGMKTPTAKNYMKRNNIKNLRDLSIQDVGQITYDDVYKRYNLNNIDDTGTAGLMLNGVYQHGPRYMTNYLNRNKAKVGLKPSQKATYFGPNAANFFNSSQRDTPDQWNKSMRSYYDEFMKGTKSYPKLSKGLDKRVSFMQNWSQDQTG